MASSRSARRLRWLVPAAVALTIALLGFVPTLSSAATPDLPALSPQQLIAKVQQSDVKAFSGTVRLTTDLGIPNVGSLQETGDSSGGGFNPATLLSGAHEAHVKVAGPDRQALSMADGLSETDVYRSGQDVWTWASEGQKVTHVVLPNHSSDEATTPEADADRATNAEPTPTPDELAKRLLDNITPSTAVSVTTPAYVADQPVYELVLAPHSADSTVDHVAIAVDAAKGFPLRVGIWPKGESKAAVELGFTDIDYSTPSGPFTFTPPAGASVTTKDLTKDHRGADANRVEGTSDQPKAQDTSGDTATVGQDWTQVLIARNVRIPRQAHDLLEATTRVSNGMLLQTKLVNAILLDDGRLVVGLVKPAALEAAVSNG